MSRKTKAEKRNVSGGAAGTNGIGPTTATAAGAAQAAAGPADTSGTDNPGDGAAARGETAAPVRARSCWTCPDWNPRAVTGRCWLDTGSDDDHRCAMHDCACYRREDVTPPDDLAPDDLALSDERQAPDNQAAAGTSPWRRCPACARYRAPELWQEMRPATGWHPCIHESDGTCALDGVSLDYDPPGTTAGCDAPAAVAAPQAAAPTGPAGGRAGRGAGGPAADHHWPTWYACDADGRPCPHATPAGNCTLYKGAPCYFTDNPPVTTDPRPPQEEIDGFASALAAQLAARLLPQLADEVAARIARSINRAAAPARERPGEPPAGVCFVCGGPQPDEMLLPDWLCPACSSATPQPVREAWRFARGAWSQLPAWARAWFTGRRAFAALAQLESEGFAETGRATLADFTDDLDDWRASDLPY